MRTSITLEDEIYKKGLANAKERGFKNSFSAYLAWLIERDTEEGVSPLRPSSTPKGAVKYFEVVQKVAEEPDKPNGK